MIIIEMNMLFYFFFIIIVVHHSFLASHANQTELSSLFVEEPEPIESLELVQKSWITLFESLLQKIDQAIDAFEDNDFQDENSNIFEPKVFENLSSPAPIIEYGEEDKKFFDYTDYDNVEFSNTPKSLQESLNVLETGECKMLNGSLGECHPTLICLAREPKRSAFSLCEWSQHPFTGIQIPIKLCCQKRTSEGMKAEAIDTKKLSSFSQEYHQPLKDFHWNFFGFPSYIHNLLQQHTSKNSAGFQQCGQTMYSMNHRRQIQLYIYEIPARRQALDPFKHNASSSNSSSRMLNDQTPRIVSGVSVSGGEIPWIISIYLRDQFVCGGSLITDRHVLTAAHCFSSTKIPDWYYIRYGSIVLHEGPVVPVKQIMIHPGYKPPVIYHDIAMLELVHPIKFSSQVQPVCLATSHMYGTNLVGLKSTVSGFGDSGFEGKQSEFLQAVDVKIIENQYCDQNYRRLAESHKKFRYGIGRTLICAGYEQGVKDACQGDSGGPLTIEVRGTHYQIGIVSFGFRCAQPQFPGIYTAVSHYRQWILGNIQS